MEKQHRFSYFLAKKILNVTGDQTPWIFVPDTKIFDTCPGSMDMKTGRLKAKHSGCYQINFAFNYGNVGWRHNSGFAQIKTTKRQYSFGDRNPYWECSPHGGNLGVFSGSALVDVDEGDEIWALFIIGGGFRGFKPDRSVFVEGIHTGQDPNTFLNGYYVGPTR